MSAQDAVRFMVRVGEEPELQAHVRATPGADLPALAGTFGFSFTASELAQVLQAQLGELTDAQLEQASGGAISAVGQYATGDAPIDPNALVQYVLRESYMQSSEDLRYYAEKVKYFNQAKKTIRWP